MHTDIYVWLMTMVWKHMEYFYWSIFFQYVQGFTRTYIITPGKLPVD